MSISLRLSIVFLLLYGSAQARSGLEVADSSRSANILTDSLFANFSCTVTSKHAVLIRWTTAYPPEGDYFIVERSQDSLQYETMSAVKISATAYSYDLSDNDQLSGAYFYRVKYIDKTGAYAYSKILRVEIPADIDVKFYPNPVDRLLIIRTTHEIDVQIMDGSGTTLINKRLQPGLQILSVAALQRGNYVLRIADKESNRIISSQLVKN